MSVRCPSELGQGGSGTAFYNDFEEERTDDIFEQGDRDLEVEPLCGVQCVKNPRHLYKSVEGTSTETPIFLNTYRYVSCFT